MIARLGKMVRRVRAGGLGRNGLFSLGQSVVAIICIFLSYRMLVEREGIESLGLWSLLMLFGGVASSFDVSGASALARSVARHGLDFAEHERATVIHTVLLTSIAVNGVFVALLLLAAPALLAHMITPSQWADAWRLFPWIAALMLMTPLAVGVSSAIDGHMRADIRAVLASTAAAIGLAIAALAIPRWGLPGFALAQTVQQAIVIVGGWLVLRRRVDRLGWLPTKWRQTIFRRTTGYALRLNVIGALSLLLEPLTKYCINLSGGTAAVGVYELAARLAMQARNLVISSTTPLIPAFAMAETSGDSYFASLLHRAQRYTNVAALTVTLISLSAAPFMCLVILREVSVEVLRFNALLALGWSINIFSLALYLAAQGQGMLRWNMLSHATIGVVIVASAMLLMPSFGSEGVVIGVAAGLIAGAVVTVSGNAWSFGLRAQFARELPVVMILALIIVASCGTMWGGADQIANFFNHWPHS